MNFSLGKIWIIFISMTLVSAGIFFFRNPDPIFNPVFYAEDGISYVTQLTINGFWKTLSAIRLNYYVFGNIILSEIALLLHGIFFPGSVLYMPQYMAVVSYLFFGVVSSLPILLFRKKFPILFLVLLTLAISFTPMPVSDFEIIGRISNTGYAFMYIAFLLIAYRLFCMKTTGTSVYLVDFGIFICASTNPVVFLLLPWMYLPYLRALFFKPRERSRGLLRNHAFVSAMVLLGVSISELVAVKIFGASLIIEGHYSEALQLNRVIEMGVARSILYPIVGAFYSHLNDPVVLGLLGAILAGIYFTHDKKNKWLYVFAWYALFIYIVCTMIFRPGLSYILNGYSTPEVSRYYYGQNMIAIFIFSVFAYDFARYFKRRLFGWGMASLLILLFVVGVPKASSFGAPTNPLNQIGTFAENLERVVTEKRFVNKRGLSDPDGDFVSVPIYPPPSWSMLLSRQLAEQSIIKQR